MGPWLCVFHLSEEFCSTSLRIESFSTSDRFVPPHWESQPHQCWKLILPRSKRHRKKSTLDIQRLIQGIATFGNKNETCEGGERKPARVFSVKPARKMTSNIDYPIISHLSNMPTFFWAKTRQIRGADTPRGRNVPGKEAGQRQTKWHTVWCAISICHTWPRR